MPIPWAIPEVLPSVSWWLSASAEARDVTVRVSEVSQGA